MDETYFKRSLISLKGVLTRNKNKFNTIKEKCTVSELQVILNRVRELSSKFENSLSELELINPDDAKLYSIDDFEDEVASVESKILDLIKKLSTVGAQRVNMVNDDEGKNIANVIPLPLPNIPVPTFDGKYTNWISFKEMFIELVHNNSKVATIFKFNFLNESLRNGDAFSFINGVSFTSANYEQVWSSLIEHYDNDERTIEIYMQNLYFLKPLKDESNLKLLREFITTLTKQYNSLKALNIPVQYWDVYLVCHIENLVYPSLRKQIIRKKSKDKRLTYQDVLQVLNDHARLLESMAPMKNTTTCNKFQSSTSKNNSHASHSGVKTFDYSQPRRVINTNLVSTNLVCFYCKDNHTIYVCKKFLNLSWSERNDWVKNSKLCVNCFLGHHVSRCNSSGCRVCHRMHNTLLHYQYKKPSFLDNKDETSKTESVKSTQIERDKSNISSQKVSLISVGSSNVQEPVVDGSILPSINLHSVSQILLSTVVIWVEGSKGIRLPCRALLDQGSQSNFITNSFCQKLRVSRQRVNIPISGINEKISFVDYEVDLSIQSRVSQFQANLKFLVLPKISNNLPLYPVQFDVQNLPASLQLADPQFFVPQELDMLIGAEIFFDIVNSSESRIITKELPPFRNTQFGYIVCGKINNSFNTTAIPSSFFCCNINELHDQVQRFWKIEDINCGNSFSLEEKACEDHYVNNVKRDETGRYSVSLPTKPNLNNLGDSYNTAVKQFHYLERKFIKNNNFKNQYCQFMNEYIALNHMQRIEYNPEKSDICYFLPHHAVFKDSNTTKIRVVFNASSKTTSGQSLNDVLMSGPTIQDDIFTILLRFRKHQIALVADIAKMYRQVLIHNDDRKLQQIVWRESPELPLSIFQLNTVTYGMTSAPFAAIRTLKQLAFDECKNYPHTSQLLIKDFYVDDFVSGANNVEKALLIKTELTSLLSKGGMELRKWASNEKQIISENVKDNSLSVLGVPWDCNDDVFIISLGSFQLENKITKRQVLSQLAQLFDPMGLCAPIVLTGKFILKEIWSSSDLNWDEQIPEELYSQWYKYIKQLNSLNRIKISRCIISKKAIQIELHGFGDASEAGYGCCIYIRCMDDAGNYVCKLLCAKSRVAPTKKHTVPRLELCAALLLAQLYDKVRKSIDIYFSRIVLWSDSEITLYRIKSTPANYPTFVANRISKIQDCCSPSLWSHIPTKQNPADIVSRGLMPSELQESTLWWNGPLFLNDSNENWPALLRHSMNNIDDPELAKPQNFVEVVTQENDLINRFSTYGRLLRISAICIRFINNCKLLCSLRKSDQSSTTDKRKHGILTTEEINDAKNKLIKVVQGQVYSKEIKQLQSNQNLHKSSNIKKFAPFIDDFGILRVGGRLENTTLKFDRIHQILLPAKHTLSKLIVCHEHHRNLHAGAQALLSFTRQQFWIIGGRQLCKNTVFKCIRCFKIKPKSIEQFMGQLPKERVTPSLAFCNVGIDFCGPFNVRYKIRSNVTSKVYICLFICFATKATHLEVVTDLSTNGFLSALRRFISRRGRCSHIFSDNASNFIGAKKELAELQRLFNNELHKHEVNKFCVEEGINWHNIPARSPHFGRLWEAAIKSAKHHLKRSLGNYVCTTEELFTLVVQIECCLNSRPLSAMSEDPSDFSPLTPGHFLIGGPINSLPEPSLLHININRLNRYQKIQYCLQEFWRRWATEYLDELQERQKWFYKNRDIKIGSLVILKEDNIPPIKWPMGKIVEVHLGDDEDFVEGTSSSQQDDGETHSEAAQSGSPSPTTTPPPIQSPIMSSSPEQSPTNSTIENNRDTNSPAEESKMVIKDEIQEVYLTESLPKLRLNTTLASDPALQPEAKDINAMRASTEDNLSDDKNDDEDYHNLHSHHHLPDLDNDIEVREVRRKDKTNNIVSPPIVTSPNLDAPRMQVFMCGPCGIRFSSLSTLEAHQTYYCSHRKDADENTVPTKKSASESGGTEPPIKSIKTGKQYACSQCSYSADKKVSLNRHMRMHQTSPSPSSITSNGGVIPGGASLNNDDSLSNPSQTQQPQILVQQPLQQQPLQLPQQIDRYCSDCDIRFSSTKTYRAHKTHYCSSRHRDENRSSNTTPKPPSIKRASQSPPDTRPGSKSPAVAIAATTTPIQPYLALPTNPIVIVPYSFVRNASVLTGPLTSVAPGVTNPESTCFILQNGSLQPIAIALAHQPTTQSTNKVNSASREQTPTQSNSNENSSPNSNSCNPDVLKSANKLDLSSRETTPLDLSVRRLSPRSYQRERTFSFSSIASLEHNRIDLDSIMEGKENLSIGSASVTPEQIVCAPSLPGSPPLTPSPKRRSNSPRAGNLSVSPNSITNPQPSVVIRPISTSDLTIRLSEPSVNSLSSQLISKQNFELALRLSSASSNSEISPQATPPLISIISNPVSSNPPTTHQAKPPQIFVKQGVSKCKECNIVFCKYENYLAHKKHYCSARNLDDAEPNKPSPPVSPQSTSPSGGTLAYQQLICAACGIKFTSLDNLSAHQMYYCPKRAELSISNVKEVRCNKCKNMHDAGQSCTTNNGSNNNVNTHKCPICDFVSTTSTDLRKHMETHGGVKAFRCSICRYKGNTLRGMRTHIRMHFDKKTSDFNEENYISCILEEDVVEIPPPAIPAPPPPVVIPPSSYPILHENISSQMHFCDVCSFSSSSKVNVIQHMKLSHASNRSSSSPATCDGSDSNLLLNGEFLPSQLSLFSTVKSQQLNKSAVEISVKQEPSDDSVQKDNQDILTSNQDHTSIKTESKDNLMDVTSTLIPISAAVIQQIHSTSPDLQSMTTAGPKYCKTCDIKFNYLSTFVAHKKFYCKSGLNEQDTGSSSTQPNSNNNSVVTRATESSV